MTSPPKDRQDSGTDPAAMESAERERPTWRCFHCDEVFTDRAEAQDHFGPSEQQIPACFIDVRHVRWLEEQHRRNVEDDTEALRTIRGLAGEHEELRRRAEEQGYARGLADAKKHPEELGLAALSSLSPELEAWSRARDAEQPPSQEAAHPVGAGVRQDDEVHQGGAPATTLPLDCADGAASRDAE